MAFCKRCGKRIIWVKMEKGWVPNDLGGIDHRTTCIPDSEYIKKYNNVMKLARSKKEKIQIGEEEFI